MSMYAYWKLNESSGIVVSDFSGNGRDGTTVNSPLWVPGKLNNCLQFNNTHWVNFNNIANFEKTQPCSYEFWFKTASSSTQIVLRKIGVLTKGMMIYFVNAKLRFNLYSDATHYLCKQTIATYNDNNWYHCVIVYHGTGDVYGVDIFINASIQTYSIVKDNLGDSILNSSPLIMSSDTGSYSFIGLLDNVLIYDHALSQSDVDAHYNGGTGREEEVAIRKTILSDAKINIRNIKNIFSDAKIKTINIQKLILSNAKIISDRVQKLILSNAKIKVLNNQQTILSNAKISIIPSKEIDLLIIDEPIQLKVIDEPINLIIDI